LAKELIDAHEVRLYLDCFRHLHRFSGRNLGGSELPTAKPESVGFSTGRLERISTAVQKNIDEKRIAGAVTLVIRHGQVAWFKAQGMQDREAAKPMRPDTIFRICSMSKPITSVAVMMLYEEGRFLLEDPISKYLPEFKNPKVLVKPANGEPYTIPATHEITIRDLPAAHLRNHLQLEFRSRPLV
jgi:CubicO group peptidase (beta-lactamase class C family)